MPRWLKVLLVVGLLAGVATFGTCSACTYWLGEKSEELKAAAELSATEGMDAFREGQTLGSRLDDPELCFERGSTATLACGTDIGNVLENGRCANNAKMLTLGCVAAAKKTPSTCDGIPRINNIRAMMKVQQARCPAGERGCVAMFQARLEYCERAARAEEDLAASGGGMLPPIEAEKKAPATKAPATKAPATKAPATKAP